MKPFLRKLERILLIALLSLGSTLSVLAQIPQNIDPGQEVDPPSLWQNSEYIVPIAIIVVFLVGYGWWWRRKRR